MGRLTATSKRGIYHNACYKNGLAVERKGAPTPNESGGKAHRNRDPAIIAAWIVGVLGVVGIVVGVLLTHVLAGSPQPGQSASSNRTPTSSLASTGTAQPRTAPSGQPSASLTYPADGTKMSRAQGFTTGGIVTGLGTDTIWILDHPAGAYYVDAEAAIENGKWEALDRPLGSQSDHLSYSLRVVAVFATPECKTLLRHLENVGDVRLRQMPNGCYQFGEVTVDVNRP